MYTNMNFLESCYKAKDAIMKNNFIKVSSKKIAKHINELEREMLGHKMDGYIKDTKFIDNSHFVYLANLLYMGYLYTKGSSPEECYKQTLYKLDDAIPRAIVLKLIHDSFFVKISEEECNSVSYYYNLAFDMMNPKDLQKA